MNAEELEKFIGHWLESQNAFYFDWWDERRCTVDGELNLKELSKAILEFLNQAEQP